MKEKEEKKGTSNQLLALVGLLAFAAAGVAFWFYRGMGKAQEDLDRAKQEFGQMTEMKRKIAVLQARSGGGKKIAAPPEKPGDILPFLEKKAREAGLTSFTPRQDRDNPFGGWREYPFGVEIRATKENPVSRIPLVVFLTGVEKERPYLKTKELHLKFAENNVLSAGIVISYFKSEGRR